MVANAIAVGVTITYLNLQQAGIGSRGEAAGVPTNTNFL